MAADPSDTDSVLAEPVFSQQILPDGFISAAPPPPGWKIGMDLNLSGPFGHGFQLPGEIRNLGVAAFTGNISRIVSLLGWASNTALCTPALIRSEALPLDIEIHPLTELPTILDWADYLVIDIPLDRISELRSYLGSPGSNRRQIPGQVLLTAPMPCAGLADCGVCATRTRRGYQLVCREGPVFALDRLEF